MDHGYAERDRRKHDAAMLYPDGASSNATWTANTSFDFHISPSITLRLPMMNDSLTIGDYARVESFVQAQTWILDIYEFIIGLQGKTPMIKQNNSAMNRAVQCTRPVQEYIEPETQYELAWHMLESSSLLKYYTCLQHISKYSNWLDFQNAFL